MATGQPEQPDDDDEEDDADDAMVDVLALEIGLRAFGDRRGDLLHALVARVAAVHVRDGPGAIGDRQQTAQNNQPNHVAVLVRVPGRTGPTGPAVTSVFKTPSTLGRHSRAKIGARRKQDFQPITLLNRI